MTFEIEIKSLLGGKDKADELRKKLLGGKPKAELTYKGKSINHYFINPTSFKLLIDNTKKLFSKEKAKKFEEMILNAKDVSVRTRETETEVMLVVKASVDDTTSSNGIARMEFEEPIKISLKELDQMLLDSGLKYQAKWSREREEYKYGDFKVCLDKNAGYGYLTEFELMIEDKNMANEAKKIIKKEMDKFGLIELDQARLARMFDHYNKNWSEYYGTERTFNIE
jgi:adenylate cyclase class IV